MKLVEYEGKEIFSRYGIPVSRRFGVLKKGDSPSSLKIDSFPCVIKAQVLAGGRGKAGGVKIARDRAEAELLCKNMLSMKMATHQTGGREINVEEVLIEEVLEIEREMYLAVTMDRKSARPVLIASKEGGMSIEELAREKPQAIVKMGVDPESGLLDFQARELAYALGAEKEIFCDMTSLAKNLVRLFIETDASLAEINPLVVSKSKKLVALDSKIVTDDNASFRHKEWESYPQREFSQIEKEAAEAGVNYIGLDGNIGCMVNGAGLAMATLDTIKLAGGNAANFLDVGGGASVEQITKAFRIILKDPKVKAIMVNIFGGIMKCDSIAAGIVEASSKVSINVPLIVRLEGTRVKEGKEILAASGLKIRQANSAWEAARIAVELAGKI